MLRALLELCRISNLPTVWTNVIAAWVIAGLGFTWHIELLWLLAGASLAYSAGMILNDACDAAWDREKRPERPIPSGRISLRTAWALGIGGLLGGYALMVWAAGASPGLTGALVGAIVLYDVYHKPWAGSVLVMGACRTLLYVTTARPATLATQRDFFCGAGVDSLAYDAGFMMGVYVVALTLIARAEGKGNVGSRYRLFLTILLILPALWSVMITAAEDRMHPLQNLALVLVPLLVFLGWTIHALHQMRKGGPAIGQAVGLLLAGIPLVDALMIAFVSPGLAIGFCCLPPLLRYWQRWVAAT